MATLRNANSERRGEAAGRRLVEVRRRRAEGSGKERPRMRGIEESLIGGGDFAVRKEPSGGCNNGGDGEQYGLGFGGR